MGNSDPLHKGSNFIYQLVRGSLYVLYKIFFCFRSEGSRRVPSEKDPRGVILAPNHASFLDPPAIGVSLKRRVTFLAKDYLFNHFLVGDVLRGIGAYPIKSQKDDFKSIRYIVRILKAGKCVVVFPEGTRSASGELKEPESGIGFLAMKSQAWVVPVYIRGSYEAYPRGAKIFRIKPVSVYYGEAFIPCQDEEILRAEDPYGFTARVIMSRIAEVKREVQAGTYTGKIFLG